MKIVRNLIADFVVIVGVVMALPLFTSSNLAVAAGEALISGVVTDSAGKPVRGAIVKAALGTKAIARYTDGTGNYQITGLESGQYQVTVDAFGFAIAKQSVDPAKGEKTNFKLTPQTDLTRLETADFAYLLPADTDVQYIYNRCSSCHGLQTPASKRGMPEAAWAGFLPFMTVHRWGTPFGFTAKSSERDAPILAKVFGPEGILGPNAKIDFSKIKRTPVSDAALKATITEYTTPSPRPAVHSVTTDPKSGIVWFSEYDALANNIARFDPETETFQELPIPLPKALAHTGTVLRDGRYIVALDRAGHEVGGGESVPTKLAITTADGKGVEGIDFPGKPQGARVIKEHPTQDNLVWIVAENETWRYNLNTKAFTAYVNPKPDTRPKGSQSARFAQFSDNPEAVDGDGYAMTVDADGTPWVTQIGHGIILRLDPDTGEWTSYRTPEIVSARGIDHDADGNIWVGDFFGHKLMMLDPKTGKFSFYQPPNPYGTPYGITIDRKRGQIWYGDTHPNNVTRFDIKTKTFAEYPLATANAAVRFLGVDPKGRAWFGGFQNGIFGVVDPGDGDSSLVSSQ